MSVVLGQTKTPQDTNISSQSTLKAWRLVMMTRLTRLNGLTWLTGLLGL
jgi:hypothetical protein